MHMFCLGIGKNPSCASKGQDHHWPALEPYIMEYPSKNLPLQSGKPGFVLFHVNDGRKGSGPSLACLTNILRAAPMDEVGTMRIGIQLKTCPYSRGNQAPRCP